MLDSVGAVLQDEDLLACTLWHVQGCEEKNMVAFEVIPLVCHQWAAVWALLKSSLSLQEGVSLFLSADEYTTRVVTIRNFPKLLQTITLPFRQEAVNLLGALLSDLGGVPSLLSLAVMEIAFSFNPLEFGCPCCMGVPNHLWQYITKVRKWLALQICRLPANSFSVPSYMPFVSGDPLHDYLRLR